MSRASARGRSGWRMDGTDEFRGAPARVWPVWFACWPAATPPRRSGPQPARHALAYDQAFGTSAYGAPDQPAVLRGRADHRRMGRRDPLPRDAARGRRPAARLRDLGRGRHVAAGRTVRCVGGDRAGRGVSRRAAGSRSGPRRRRWRRAAADRHPRRRGTRPPLAGRLPPRLRPRQQPVRPRPRHRPRAPAHRRRQRDDPERDAVVDLHGGDPRPRQQRVRVVARRDAPGVHALRRRAGPGVPHLPRRRPARHASSAPATRRPATRTRTSASASSRSPTAGRRG